MKKSEFVAKTQFLSGKFLRFGSVVYTHILSYPPPYTLLRGVNVRFNFNFSSFLVLETENLLDIIAVSCPGWGRGASSIAPHVCP